MMEDYRVTTDELFAAGATFTLLAWGFAYAQLACQTWLPGSFSGDTYSGQPWSFLELLYMSFNNLSSTGLGDIVPITAPARVLVMLEQFAGVAYIAVVVSRLIGLTIVRHKDNGIF
jgi:Ion channel